MSEIFDEIDVFPDPGAKQRYEQLVGLEAVQKRLIKEGSLLIDPSLLNSWSMRHYKKAISLVEIFRRKPPLFIFAGDVGTGKTTLAETFGDELARQHNIAGMLYRLSLKSRGNGMVGDMTKMITNAFEEVRSEAKRNSKGKKPTTAYILLIDEADALAQSREETQMHHEDKSGVNALIRGIDSIAHEKIPVLIVMCTNRLSAIDPAVKRRAADIFLFERPNEEQRAHILVNALRDIGLNEKQLKSLVDATGPSNERGYGYTHSDILQRLLPGILLDAFPDEAINFDKALAYAKRLIPTSPFQDK